MTLRLEIVSAGRGAAVVETYLDGTRTAMTAALPVAAARLRGEASGLEVVDHTRQPDLADEIRRRAVRRMDRGDFRP
jgi:hypothetical protein